MLMLRIWRAVPHWECDRGVFLSEAPWIAYLPIASDPLVIDLREFMTEVCVEESIKEWIHTNREH